MNVTSAESDALFDSWDDDGGGSLDVKELKAALDGTMREAKDYSSRPDPAQQHMQQLLKFATMVEDAAAAMLQADAMEADLEEHSARMLTRADVRLGELLQKRLIKPGEFVVRFSKSSGANAGELSKADFRKAVLELFNSKKNASPRRRPPSSAGGASAAAEEPPKAAQEVVTSLSEIDSVFDECVPLRMPLRWPRSHPHGTLHAGFSSLVLPPRPRVASSLHPTYILPSLRLLALPYTPPRLHLAPSNSLAGTTTTVAARWTRTRRRP